MSGLVTFHTCHRCHRSTLLPRSVSSLEDSLVGRKSRTCLSGKRRKKLSATRQMKWAASLPMLRVCGEFCLPLPLRLVPEQVSFTGLMWLTLICPKHNSRSPFRVGRTEAVHQVTECESGNRCSAQLNYHAEGLSQRTPRGFGVPIKERKTAAQQQRASQASASYFAGAIHP